MHSTDNQLITPSQTVGADNQRLTKNDTITIAKGVGIILMVMGHSALPKPLSHFIYVFHMPLFFLVAGYCFKTAYCKAPAKFLKRRVKGLWWPFVKWNLIFLILHNLMFDLGLYDEAYTSARFLRQAVMTLGLWSPEQMLGGFWFFGGLFFASLISWAVIWFTKYRLIPIAVFISGMLMTTILLNLFMPDNFFAQRVSQYFRFAIYFLSGFILKGIHDRYGSPRSRIFPSAIICLILVGAVSVYFPGEILDTSTWQLPARYIGAIAGSVGVLIFSSRLRSPRIRKFLMFCGESTILILVWHFLSFKLLTYILINIHGLPVSELTAFPVHKGLAIHYWPLYVLFGLVIPLGIQISYNTIRKKLTDTGSRPSDTAQKS